MAMATAADAGGIVALRDHLARWQISRGIQQWRPGEVDPAVIADQASGGQWFVLRDLSGSGGAAGVIATARVLNADPHAWGSDLGNDGTAGYLHALMVHRDHAGQGLGAAVLCWFERFTLACGRTLARLDCVAGNAVLRAYYTGHGYHEHGITEFGPDRQWRPVMRLQKVLDGSDAGFR
ncbi:GNAT family N-acetyltransferase [Pseudactinotalea sp. Z1739]|uniref:GNAT family N-acetyltransferase n=1 Tax=Pseudactinotalea sp. Z1739 TaxID=3413028 RepID=UPI003C7B4FAE